MPESYSWDLFQENVKALASEQRWLDANSMFALARNAANPDEAVAMAEQLRVANQSRLSMSMAGFMDDGRLYERPTLGLQLHRFLTSDIGEMPIRENHVTDVQQRLIEQGYASPELAVNGVWGRPWQDAMSEYTRDAFEEQKKGNKPGALSVQGVLKFMTNMFPTLAYEATVGMVKSFPSDVRHLMGNALTGTEMIGGAARLGWNVMTGHESFDEALADELRSTIETKATLTGVSPKQAAEDWGLVNAHRLGLPQAGGMMAKPGQNPNLKYGVALEPGIDDMDFDPWKAVQSNLRDVGTAFLAYSVAKTAAKSAGMARAAWADRGTDIAYARGRAAVQRAPGTIGRKVFRRPETLVPVRELPGVAGRVAAAEAERDAFAIAARGGVVMPQTFQREGIARTMAFLNDPLLAETVPVAPGRFGWYAARTALAKPYQNAAVREAGNLFQQGIKTGVQARIVGNIESAGPGDSELLQNIHDTDVLRDFNKNVLGKYGVTVPIEVGGEPLRLSPSIDDLMMFIHAPLSPGARTAALGAQVERNSVEWGRRANRWFRERSMAHVWDRAIRSAGLKGGYNELIRDIGRQLDAMGADSTLAEQYARDFIWMKHDMYVRTRYAEQGIADELTRLRETGEIGAMSGEDLRMYERGTELYHAELKRRIQDLGGDAAARQHAHDTVNLGYDAEDFVNWLVNDAQHYAFAGRGRMADDLDMASAFSGRVGYYMHAVNEMRNGVLPQVSAHLNEVLDDFGFTTAQAMDLQATLHGLRETGVQLQDGVTRAEEVLRAAQLPERDQLQAMLDEANAAVTRAQASHDGNLLRQAQKHQRGLRRIVGLLNADRAVINTKRTLLDQAREARSAFEREVINATTRDSGWQQRAELLGVDVDELVTAYEGLKALRLADKRRAGQRWTGRDTQKVAQEISRKYLADNPTLADLQAAEQKAEEALATAHRKFNDRISQHRVAYRPRARRENRYEFPEDTLQFEPTPKPELVDALDAARTEAERVQGLVDAGPDIYSPAYTTERTRLESARMALDHHNDYQMAVEQALDQVGVRIQLDTAENFDPRNWGIARIDLRTRNEVRREIERIRESYRSLAAEPLPEAPTPIDEFDLLAMPAAERAAAEADYAEAVAAYEAALEARVGGADPIAEQEIQQAIYTLAHDEFGIAQDTMRAALSKRFRHESRTEFFRNKRRAAGLEPGEKAGPNVLKQWHQEFNQLFADETERLLLFLESRSNNLAGDVMLDPRVAPQSLIDAQTRLNDLGYKMVYGRNMGQQLDVPAIPDTVSWQRRGRLADTVARLGLKPFVPVSNTTVAEAQKAGRLKLYRQVLTNNPDMRRPGLDAMLVDRMISELNAGVHRGLGHGPDTMLRRAGLNIGRGVTGRWRASRLMGPLRMRERQILDAYGAAGGDMGNLTASMEREFDQISGILRGTQHRDINRRAFVKFFTDRRVWEAYLPEASKSLARPFTEREANQMYRAMVRGYMNAPLEEAGWAQFDNIVRAASSWVGGNWTVDARVPFTRNLSVPVSAGAQQMIAGGVVGGVAGGVYGAMNEQDLDSWARDVAIGAGLGAAASRGLGLAASADAQWAVGVQGAIANSSNSLKSAVTDLRFALSPMFSLRRISKTNFKMSLEGIDPTFRPLQRLEEIGLRNFAERSGVRYKDLLRPDGRQKIARDRALQRMADRGMDTTNAALVNDQTYKQLAALNADIETFRYAAITEGRQLVREAFPEFNRTNLEYSDDAERMLREQDVFQLYNGSSYEAYAAYHLRQRGMTTEQIREQLIHMFQYGTGEKVGRSAFERTANFVFFPWSFDKTLYRNTGVYLLNRPGQMAATVAGLAAYKQFSETYPDVPGASEWVKKHLPMLKEVEKLNAFGHGLSPGELGGINAPLLQLFIPHQWASNEESVGALRRFLPIMKDFESVLKNVKDQYYVAQAAAHNVRSGYVGGNEEMKALYGTWANPAISTAIPSEQLSDAYRFQAQLYKYFQMDLAYNADTRDDTRKSRFPDDPQYGKYRGDIINKEAIRSMVHDKYPAYDANGAVRFMTEGQQQIQDYRRTVKMGERPDLAPYVETFASKAAALSTYLANAEEGDYPDGMTAAQATSAFAQVTDELRAGALWLVQQDPQFYEVYRNNFQRVLGPLTKIGNTRQGGK